MTIRDAVNRLGGEISQYYSAGEGCGFYPCSAEDAALSADSRESRGILFRAKDMVVCFGEPMIVRYDDIAGVTLIPCYESPFEDELVIEYSGGKLRISDCSLHKPLLKQLIDGIVIMKSSGAPDAEFGKIVWLSSSTDEGWASPDTIEQELAREIADRAPEPVLPEPTAPVRGEKGETTEPSEPAEPAEPAAVKIPVSVPEDDFSDEPDLDSLDRKQTMDYLLASISELNSSAPAEDFEEVGQISEIERLASESALPDPEPLRDFTSPFTVEPQSDDIYIRASAKLREICESGRLNSEQIDAAVVSGLVPTAETYSRIIAGAEQLPDRIAPRIAALKSASERLDEYFALGEDIAARVMFFMLFQMLSYSDRIAETAETKAALNDFFRRYGPSGVILSMLDSEI